MSKDLARYRRIVTKINKLESNFETFRERDFSAKTAVLKMKVGSGESLDAILPEAFALVREAARRTLGLRTFSVQLQGAIGAHEGRVVEMKTGEGKTLAIIFPAFLNALKGEGVHIVTANDYLAQRDAQEMGKVFALLGVSVGVVTSETDEIERQISYLADITYVTNNEVGFDFLKDNMLFDAKSKKQRGLNFAIIDEADSVLIDGAQTPLVISDSKEGEGKEKNFFPKVNVCIRQLVPQVDYRLNHREKTVNLTIAGIKKLEKLLGVENLYSDKEFDYIYFVERLLKAYLLFSRDRDYIVEDGKIVIVDEFTGRLMPNHRYFQGIHQAIEMKENLEIQGESKTLASITFQHLFKKYRKLAGFTGTAESSTKEFLMIYKKEVVAIPTNKKIARKDKKDRFFLNWEDKIAHLTWTVQEDYFKHRAVLVGTRSVEKSHKTHLSLLAKSIPSNVLNAKHTQREAEIVSGAGKSQTITVATNMAGRGTDIRLDEQVRENGGLVVIGTERHNARRIDNQLIGRCGRQGDPGSTQFLISAEDELFKNFYRKKFTNQLRTHKDFSEGVQDPKLQKIADKAQKRIEELFFEQRILSYEFDKVMEVQRKSFYAHRNRVLNDKNLKEETLGLVKKQIFLKVAQMIVTEGKIDKRQVERISAEIDALVGNRWFKLKLENGKDYSIGSIRDLIYQKTESYYTDFEFYITSDRMRKVESVVTLKVLDLLWVNHLQDVEQIQEAALVSSIGKNDFFDEYKVKMAQSYRNMLLSAPKVISRTLFGTMNEMFKKGKKVKKR